MSEAGGWMELGPHEALTMGSELWLVADLKSSSWARKIDWYLNFQLSRAANHVRADISPELATTAESWEFDPPVIASYARAPLLVASSNFLPNQMTVQIADQGELWVQAARAVVNSLRPRSIRVFLPPELSRHTLSQLWGTPDEPSPARMTVVLEPGSRSS